MIVHYLWAEKFTEPFIDFVERHFDPREHVFIVLETGAYKTTARANVIHLPKSVSSYRKLATLARYLNRADKVILHGLFDHTLLVCYLLQPWLLKRSYWVIWGGDLYFYRRKRVRIRSQLLERVRAYVIKRLGHLVTYVKGDYELAKQWYGATGTYHECYMYPSNLYKSGVSSRQAEKVIKVLVGNSADPTNNHLEVFGKLQQFAGASLRVYCPLSYGDSRYADHVARAGTQAFGDGFVALREFMAFDQYLSLLSEIDIAIFAHERQQAMGNTITLLGLGKKVFIRNDVSQWALFRDMGIKVFDVDQLDISPMEIGTAQNNKVRTMREFSESNLRKQWESVFESASIADVNYWQTDSTTDDGNSDHDC